MRFPPAPPSDSKTDPAVGESTLPDPVFTNITLTRGLYSQLVLQRFFAPKPFERVKWMEAGTSDKENDERRRELGMKLVSAVRASKESQSDILIRKGVRV